MDQEQTQKKSRGLEEKIDLALLEQRKVFLSDAVDSDTAKDIIRKLWYLDYIAPGKPILFVINSPGGSVDSGLAIWDQIQMISSPVVTMVTGLAASMGSLLALSGGPGKRLATPNSRIMIHQPLISGVIRGQATDLDIQAREMLKTREMIVEFYARATGADTKTIEKAINRDNWMTAAEARDFGLLDHVVTSFKDVEPFLQG